MRGKNRKKDLPIDQAHTTREHPGEAIDDSRNWPGYGLVFLGIATMGMTLVAAGYGFAGWAILGAILCVLFFVVGAGIVLAEHAHVKHLEGRHLTGQLGH